MIAKTKRIIKPGYEFDRIIPTAVVSETTVKRGAIVEDTIAFIPKAVRMCLWQTEELSGYLQGESITETCANIWHFLYDHVAYNKDRRGYEQIRSPRRVWHDRKNGVDCDCYTTFISTVLTNLDIPHLLRITKYKEDRFQHIYPVAFDEHGEEIIIDCVTDEFNYEVPFTEKQDTPMDLQFLDGIDPEDELDDIELMGIDEIEGIMDRIRQTTSKVKAAVSKVPIVKKVASKPIVQKVTSAVQQKAATVRTAVQSKASSIKSKIPQTNSKSGIINKVANTVKAGLHVVNRINPTTVVLRNGLLASLKLNVFNVAGRLKWTYLSDAEVAKRGIDKVRFGKLKKVREKLEGIFYSAGGKQENFRKAILEGKGNKNNDVSGFHGWDTEISLRELLGEDLFYAENVDDMDGFEGFGSLGEPVTAAAVVGSASTIMVTIAGLIKAIGSIFPKKQKGSEDFEAGNGGSNATPELPQSIQAAIQQNNGGGVDEDAYVEEFTDSYIEQGDTNNYDGSLTPAESGGAGQSGEGFWDQNKNWLKPSLFGVGGLGLLIAGYKFLKSRQQAGGAKRGNKPASPLNGVKNTRKKPKAKPKKAVAKRRRPKKAVRLL